MLNYSNYTCFIFVTLVNLTMNNFALGKLETIYH